MNTSLSPFEVTSLRKSQHPADLLNQKYLTITEFFLLDGPLKSSIGLIHISKVHRIERPNGETICIRRVALELPGGSSDISLELGHMAYSYDKNGDLLWGSTYNLTQIAPGLRLRWLVDLAHKAIQIKNSSLESFFDWDPNDNTRVGEVLPEPLSRTAAAAAVKEHNADQTNSMHNGGSEGFTVFGASHIY